MNKKLILSISALALVVEAGTLGLQKAYADETTRELPPFMQGLAKRFGLNEDEVKTYFEENRPERTQRGNGMGFESRLNEAVTAGTISEDQKNALLTKHEELMGDRQTAHENFQAWAEEQGIDLESLNLGGGMKRGGEFGTRKGM